MPELIFKPYKQNQMCLMPPSIEEMIEKKHPVRSSKRSNRKDKHQTAAKTI